MIVPHPPSALTDRLARSIAERLGSAMKQPMFVENKPGAGTLVGAGYVAKPADGYTLLMITSTTLGISPARDSVRGRNALRIFSV